MWLKAYGRKSRALGDADEVDVVAHQTQHLLRLAEQDGFPIAEEDVIAEIGSGETVAQRPRFLALLRELEQSPPAGGGRLYVTEVSRLSRADIEEIGRIMRILRNAGVRVRDRGRLYDLTNPDDEQFFVFCAAQARGELSRYKHRAKLAHERNVREGRIRNGAAPYGYRYSKDSRTLHAHPDQFPKLKWALREVALHSVYVAAKQLGIDIGSLYKTLKNPVICGWPVLTHATHPPVHALAGQRYRLPREEWVWPEKRNDSYPAACSLEQWEALQTTMSDRWKLRLKTEHQEGWCRGVVKFLGREGRVVLGSANLGATYGYYTYQLDRSQKHNAYINRHLVHKAAYEALTSVLCSPARLRVAEKRYLAEKAAAILYDQSQRADSPKTRLARVQRKYQSAVDDEYDQEDIHLRQALTERRLRLSEELKRIEREAAAENAKVMRSDPFALQFALLQQIGSERVFESAWKRLDDQQKGAITQLVINSVEVLCVKIPGHRQWAREVQRVRFTSLFEDDAP